MDDQEPLDEDERYQPVWRDNHLHVLSEQCSSCIFRPGNLMQLKSGRVRGMIDECKREQTAIACHQTLGDEPAICRGFFDRYADDIWRLRFARHLGVVREVAPPG